MILLLGDATMSKTGRERECSRASDETGGIVLFIALHTAGFSHLFSDLASQSDKQHQHSSNEHCSCAGHHQHHQFPSQYYKLGASFSTIKRLCTSGSTEAMGHYYCRLKKQEGKQEY
jgi:hypothetical protein